MTMGLSLRLLCSLVFMAGSAQAQRRTLMEGLASGANAIYVSTSGASVYVMTAGTMTVKGNKFSVGGSSFTVAGGSATVAYNLTAGSFSGSGAALTNLPSSEANTYASSKTFSGASGVLISGAIAPTSYLLTLSSANAVTMFGVTGGGHVVSSGTTPSISCNAGTGAMLADSNDGSGRFVAGAAAANCTITFVNAWSKKPSCVCNDESAIVVVQAIATTTTLKCSVAISMSGDTINYLCWGAP